MTNILTLTFEPKNGGAKVVKKFGTRQENSLLGHQRALAEALPALRKEGFAPFFSSLSKNGPLNAENLEAIRRGDGWIEFQGYRFSWFLEQALEAECDVAA